MIQARTLHSNELKQQIDIAIITIREDEEDAVLRRLQPRAYCEDVPCSISYPRAAEGYYSVAIARCLGQGPLKAQDLTEKLISKLSPNWIIAVGIAGGVPDNEFSLGDVILADHVYDLNVTASKQGTTEYSLRGGEVHEHVTRVLSSLIARSKDLRGWNSRASILAEPSLINFETAECYGANDFKESVLDSLKTNFAKGRRPPRYTVRPIVSSGALIKDTAKVEVWRPIMRHFAAIEMEFAGVYQAAKGRGRVDGTDLPVLTIRGISDIVGLKRTGDWDWTNYARNTAAALATKLIVRGFFGKPRTGDPPYPIKANKNKKRPPASSTADIQEPKADNGSKLQPVAPGAVPPPLRDADRGELFESLHRCKALTDRSDDSFAPILLKRRVTILRPDASMETEELLQNVTQQECTELVRYIVTDAPTEFQYLQIQNTVELNGGFTDTFSAAIQHKTSKDGRTFKITFGFRGRVVTPSAIMRFRWSCIVPASVARNEDYWVFPFLFKKPAQEMHLELAFQTEPADQRLFLDTPETLRPIPLQCRGHRDHSIVYGASMRDAQGMYLFTWRLT